MKTSLLQQILLIGIGLNFGLCFLGIYLQDIFLVATAFFSGSLCFIACKMKNINKKDN